MLDVKFVTDGTQMDGTTSVLYWILNDKSWIYDKENYKRIVYILYT